MLGGGAMRAVGMGDSARESRTAGSLLFGGCLFRGNGKVGAEVRTARKHFNTEDGEDHRGPRSRGGLPPPVPSEDLRDASWSSVSSVLKFLLALARSEGNCTRQHPMHRENRSSHTRPSHCGWTVDPARNRRHGIFRTIQPHVR